MVRLDRSFDWAATGLARDTEAKTSQGIWGQAAPSPERDDASQIQ